jgi:hypothetical protein
MRHEERQLLSSLIPDQGACARSDLWEKIHFYFSNQGSFNKAINGLIQRGYLSEIDGQVQKTDAGVKKGKEISDKVLGRRKRR